MDFISVLGVFIAVLIIDFRIFLFLLFMVIIIGITERRRIRVRIEKDKIYRKENERVSGFVGELVRGVRDIKMLSAEKSFLHELKHRLTHLNESRYDMMRSNRNYNFVIRCLKDILEFSVICILVYFIYIQEMSIALALVLYNYVGKITYIISSYSYLIEGLKDFNLSTSRIYDIICTDQFSKEKFGEKHLDKIEGNFEFKNVWFSYHKDEPVLKNLSFQVKANTTVAFVGKSGVGKTTIFNLLCKMYEPQKGKILIDGVDINTLDRESIRDNITIISQNPYIFNVSIRDNLRLVKEDLSDDEMREACRMACLDDFIQSLPNGYDTIVGEGGITLSGGQRQRLAIARAFVQKTEIILFDEATSALDNDTQMKIQEAINNLKKDFTILIIAHRLSTIIYSDRILYLEDGKIVQEGTHNELLKTCKGYQKLYEAEIEK
jgi:ABC-type multidrug transport system fused ATPase/permease subunit